MIKKSLIILIAIPMMILFAGCARKIKARKLMSISIGMDKRQVLQCLGEPSILRGSITNKFDQVVELWEYSVTKGRTAEYTALATVLTICSFGLYGWLFAHDGITENYWLYFYNDKLAQWGKAGDWEKAADNIQEIRFR